MQMPIKTHIPPVGDCTDLLERLTTYISRFDKKWINEIVPAKTEYIDTLKNLTQINKYNYHFPKEYEIYLKYMGQDDKDLLKTQLPGYASVSEIIDTYEGIHEEEPDTLSDKYIHFFQTELFYGQLSFDFTQTDNPQIVKTDEDSQFVSYYADNFEKFSKTYDFQRAWFSDLTHHIGFKDGIGFYIENRDNSLCGFIAGDLDKQIDNIAETLLVELNVIKIN